MLDKDLLSQQIASTHGVLDSEVFSRYEDLTQTAIDQSELLVRLRAEVWLRDLWLFNKECLGNGPHTNTGLAGMDDPTVKEYVTWAGERVLDWVANRHKQTKRRKLAIIVPRECYKSTAITQALPVWINMHLPDAAGIIDCAKVDMAEKMLATTKEHYKGTRATSQLVSHMGQMYDKSARWNQREMTVAIRQDRARKDPTMWTTGVEVGSTGTHVDFYIMDDPITQELMSDTWFDTVWHHYKGTLPVVRKDGLFVLVATRYAEADLMGRIIEREIEPVVRRNYGREDFPEDDFRENWWKYADQAGWDVCFKQVHDGDEQLVFPVVWPQDRIQEIRDIDESEYASQLQNQPSARRDSPISDELIEALMIDVKDVPKSAFNKVTMHMDLAWKDEDNYLKGKGDFSTIQVWLHDTDGTVYYWDGWRGKEKMDDGFKQAWLGFMQTLAARDIWPQMLTYDKQAGGEGDISEIWFRKTATDNGFFCPPILRLSRARTKKLDRILAAARYWRDRRVRLVKGAGDLSSLAYEMVHLGYSKNDDMADAAADVFHKDVYSPGRMSLARGTGQRRSEEAWTTAVDHLREGTDGFEIENQDNVVQIGGWF